MTTTKEHRAKLPRSFDGLVELMAPRAILDDAQHEETVEMIDRLMAAGKLSGGQALYMETLVQLVQAYESSRHSIDAPGGLDALKHLMDEHGMNASALARLLGVHPSMGSKILKGERSLTVDHLKRLSTRFKVGPALFME
jgi:HTH-type transcriptional regulator / antitoxin HigA